MDIIEQIKNTIGKKLFNFVCTALIIIVILVIAKIFLDFKGYQLLSELNIINIEYEQGKEKQGEERTDENIETPPTPSPRIEIENIYVTPVAFDIPSSFYAEITNSSPYAEANEVVVMIDFGKAKIEQCATRPAGLSRGGDNYIFELYVGKVPPKHTISINCHISLPVFNKILVNGENISQALTFTQDQMQNQMQVIRKTANRLEVDIFGTFIGLVISLVIIYTLLFLRRLAGGMGEFMSFLAGFCIMLLLIWLIIIIIILGFN